MRCAALVLLGLGVPAFCQSAPANHVNPDKLFQIPQDYVQLGRDVTKFPLGFDPSQTAMPQTVVVLPELSAKNKPVDPGIILRPPIPRDDREGQRVARNLYPNLRLVPIGPSGR
jgi:hypothetical protein